jgi:hypothetical protein
MAVAGHLTRRGVNPSPPGSSPLSRSSATPPTTDDRLRGDLVPMDGAVFVWVVPGQLGGTAWGPAQPVLAKRPDCRLGAWPDWVAASRGHDHPRRCRRCHRGRLSCRQSRPRGPAPAHGQAGSTVRRVPSLPAQRVPNLLLQAGSRDPGRRPQPPEHLGRQPDRRRSRPSNKSGNQCECTPDARPGLAQPVPVLLRFQQTRTGPSSARNLREADRVCRGSAI